MNRVTMTAAVLAVIPAGGCAGLMERYTAQAPEWFDAAAKEVKGEGYPQLAQVPPVRDSARTESEQAKAEAELLEIRRELDAESTNIPPIRTADEIRATAAQLRAATDGKAAPDTDVTP